MSKQFWGVIAVIVIIFVGIFAFSGKNSPAVNAGNAKPTQHVEGQGQDGITLVEYGDFQCPFCGEYFPTVKQVQTEYNSQITFQFRNFPLVSVHQNAFAGARAAEAAGLQGKYWQMHDLLYEQNDLYYGSNETDSTWINASNPETFFVQYAQEIGLNAAQFKADYESTKVNNIINADMAAGNKLNVTGTPTFYLDGKVIQVGNSTAAFEKAINAEIAKKTGNASTNSSSSTTDTSGDGTTAQTKK